MQLNFLAPAHHPALFFRPDPSAAPPPRGATSDSGGGAAGGMDVHWKESASGRKVKTDATAAVEASAAADLGELLDAFAAGDGKSFASFRALWGQRRYSLLHHACPKCMDRRNFLQMLYGTLLARLNAALSEGAAAAEALALGCAVLFALHCLHDTQVLVPREPVRVDPVSYSNLRSLRFRCADGAAALQTEAFEVFRLMEARRALLLCLYIGPRSLDSGAAARPEPPPPPLSSPPAAPCAAPAPADADGGRDQRRSDALRELRSCIERAASDDPLRARRAVLFGCGAAAPRALPDDDDDEALMDLGAAPSSPGGAAGAADRGDAGAESGDAGAAGAEADAGRERAAAANRDGDTARMEDEDEDENVATGEDDSARRDASPGGAALQSKGVRGGRRDRGGPAFLSRPSLQRRRAAAQRPSNERASMIARAMERLEEEKRRAEGEQAARRRRMEENRRRRAASRKVEGKGGGIGEAKGAKGSSAEEGAGRAEEEPAAGPAEPKEAAADEDEMLLKELDSLVAKVMNGAASADGPGPV